MVIMITDYAKFSYKLQVLRCSADDPLHYKNTPVQYRDVFSCKNSKYCRKRVFFFVFFFFFFFFFFNIFAQNIDRGYMFRQASMASRLHNKSRNGNRSFSSAVLGFSLDRDITKSIVSGSFNASNAQKVENHVFPLKT